MKISQQFTVARPLTDVWAFFQDIPAVARCMPGAELTADKGEGLYAGNVKAKLGPFGANFEGEARVSADPATHSGHVEGKGVDKRGGSRTRMVMDYRLTPAEGGTAVTVDADVTLAGAIAQFGRTSLMQETANILVRDFAGALEAQLGQAPPRPALAAQPAGQPPEARTPEAPSGAAPARPGAPAAAAAEPQTVPGTRTAGPLGAAVPARTATARHEIRAGSVGLRALWAWLKSLVRGLFSGSNGQGQS